MHTSLATTDQEFKAPAMQVQEFEDAAMPVWFSGKDYTTTFEPGDEVYICDLDYEEYGEVFEFIAHSALTDASCFIKNAQGQKLVHTRLIALKPEKSNSPRSTSPS